MDEGGLGYQERSHVQYGIIRSMGNDCTSAEYGVYM